jgi:hypothetical protein
MVDLKTVNVTLKINSKNIGLLPESHLPVLGTEARYGIFPAKGPLLPQCTLKNQFKQILPRVDTIPPAFLLSRIS